MPTCLVNAHIRPLRFVNSSRSSTILCFPPSNKLFLIFVHPPHFDNVYTFSLFWHMLLHAYSLSGLISIAPSPQSLPAVLQIDSMTPLMCHLPAQSLFFHLFNYFKGSVTERKRQSEKRNPSSNPLRNGWKCQDWVRSKLGASNSGFPTEVQRPEHLGPSTWTIFCLSTWPNSRDLGWNWSNRCHIGVS